MTEVLRILVEQLEEDKSTKEITMAKVLRFSLFGVLKRTQDGKQMGDFIEEFKQYFVKKYSSIEYYKVLDYVIDCEQNGIDLLLLEDLYNRKY